MDRLGTPRSLTRHLVHARRDQIEPGNEPQVFQCCSFQQTEKCATEFEGKCADSIEFTAVTQRYQARFPANKQTKTLLPAERHLRAHHSRRQLRRIPDIIIYP